MNHVKAKMSSGVGVPASGVIYIHACPRALSPHVEWALAGVFGAEVKLDWTDQPIAPTSVRAEVTWTGPSGLGARIASALLAFHHVRHEVTEDASADRPGERYAATPSLGLFRADIGPHGDVMVSEERLRNALKQARIAGGGLDEDIERLIGDAWDAELEPFRCAHEDTSPVRVLHDVV